MYFKFAASFPIHLIKFTVFLNEVKDLPIIIHNFRNTFSWKGLSSLPNFSAWSSFRLDPNQINPKTRFIIINHLFINCFVHFFACQRTEQKNFASSAKPNKPKKRQPQIFFGVIILTNAQRITTRFLSVAQTVMLSLAFPSHLLKCRS
jgi:hypothetical protein